MTVKNTPFQEVLDDRHGWIERYKKETGRKIAGYFCDYVPEEVLWAAGYTTVRITGGTGNIQSADHHLQSNVCSFARRCLDQALEGVFDYLDALVVPHTCDVITKMYDLWAYRLTGPEFIHYIWVPHKVFDKDAPAVMEGEIKRLVKSLSEHTGQEITDESLAEAIRVYDRSRSLLKKVYDLRKRPSRVSGVEAFSLALSSILAPKDLHADWTETWLSENGDREAIPDRPRVMLAASVLDDLSMLETIEDAGAWVVADDVCTGSRYFYDLVGDPGENPLKALTSRYLNKLPCPRSFESMQRRTEHILGQAREFDAQGIVFDILRCCDAHLFQYPILKERAEKEGLSVLYVQGDRTVGINEGTKNRLQAFAEMLST